MKAYHFIAGLVLLGFLPQATYAQAVLTKPISELPKPTLVQENRATLLERGCVEVVGDAAAQTVAQPKNKPVHLYPNDWTVGKYVFCPEAIRDTVTVKEGKVLAFWLPIIGGILLGAAIWKLFGGVPDAVLSILLFVVNTLLEYLVSIGIAVVGFVSLGAEYLLTAGNFTQHSLVIRAWPFLQGLVNIGFLIALIYIAILVVLRAGDGLGKLLPRLIIAALLLNFSLVVGGILIDASRLLMAAELRLLWAGSVPSDVPLGFQILKNSVIFDGVCPGTYSRTESPRVSCAILADAVAIGDVSVEEVRSKIVADKAMAVFVLWVLIFGLLYLTVGLVVRYVALILLLAASPVAYLAIALPNLGGVSKQWWSTFWKYLIYGPIALFFLVTLTILPRATIAPNTPVVADLLMLSVVAGLLYAGIQVPKRLGGFGAGLITGFSQRLSSFAKRNPKLALGVGAALGGGVPLLLGGAAGYSVGKRVARGGQDFYKRAKDNYTSRLRRTGIGRFILGPRRNDKGELMPGEETPFTRLADRVSPYKSAEARAAVAAGLNINFPALQENQLAKSAVASVLSVEQIDNILRLGTAAQQRALMRHRDVARRMSGPIGEALRSYILNLPTNTANDDVNRSNRELKNSLINHLTEIDKE